MKKYPKNLAEINILADTVQYLYERADSCELALEDYKARLASEEDAEWLKDAIAEYEAKIAAYIKLAEKITK